MHRINIQREIAEPLFNEMRYFEHTESINYVECITTERSFFSGTIESTGSYYFPICMLPWNRPRKKGCRKI